LSSEELRRGGRGFEDEERVGGEEEREDLDLGAKGELGEEEAAAAAGKELDSACGLERGGGVGVDVGGVVVDVGGVLDVFLVAVGFVVVAEGALGAFDRTTERLRSALEAFSLLD